MRPDIYGPGLSRRRGRPDKSSPNYGQYGYYYVRGSFTSPYGGIWNIHSNNLSFYLQDSWTIKNRLTLNFGIRAEGQYIPSMTTNTSYAGYTAKPVKFNLGQTLAPRLGAVYDVFGDSNLKIFASFGIYYDVMKLYMAELTFGGWKRKQDYYPLQDPDWTKIAASGELDDKVSQAAGDTYAGSMDFLPPSFNRVDPDLKPTAQREISFGAEKKLMEDLSVSVRFVNKHLLRTIEDVGVYVPVNPATGTTTVSQDFWITNPGYGVSRPVSQGGQFSDAYLGLPEGDKRIQRPEHRLRKEVQPQLAGRLQLYAEPGLGRLLRPGQRRRRGPARTECRAGLRPVVHGVRCQAATSSTARCPRTGPITSRPTAPMPSPSG